jgi:tRNA pseudouridine13 synthase
MKLKEKFEDFYVEEVLHLDVKERGDYIYFTLDKTNWTTLKAIQFIADALYTNSKRFSFAGQKDRRGVTKQTVSAFRISERQLERVRLRDIKLTFLGYGDKPIGLGSLSGNKFRIVAKELEKPLEYNQVVVNYYDNQRFGGYRPNLHKIGKLTLQGKYEEAVKLFLLYPFPNETADYRKARRWMEKYWGNWVPQKFPKHLIMEKKIIGHLQKNPTDFKGALKSLPRQLFTMITQSYQSYIFNESLARYLKSKYDSYKEVEYSCGTFVFVDTFEDIDWELVGYESKLEGDQKKFIEEVMREEDIWYETFNCEVPALASKGIQRKAMVEIKDLTLGDFKNNTQFVSFFLQKGSYATVVLKSLE